MNKILAFVVACCVITAAFPVMAAEEKGENANGMAETNKLYYDGNRMSDEEFLGKWNVQSQTWEVEGKINYNYQNSPLLKQAEEAVKSADLQTAKELLFEYYQTRAHKYPYEQKRESVDAIVLAEGIYASETPALEIFQVHLEPQWYTFDVTSSIGSNGGSQAFLIHAVDRDFGLEGSEAIASFGSKESEFPAYLTVEQESGKTTVPVAADMFLRGGAYTGTNYGTETQLLVSELWPSTETELALGDSPATSGTRQAHLNFDLNGLKPGEKILNATLHVYGNSSKDGQCVALFRSPDNAWDENSISREDFPVRVLSYRGIPGEYDWQKPEGAHVQFFNVQCRLWNLGRLFQETIETQNPWYARRGVEILLDFIQDNGGLTYDWYDLEKRLNAAFRGDPYIQTCFWGALEADRICRVAKTGEVLDGESFVGLLKFMWQEPDAMTGPLMEGQINTNGLAFAINSLMRYCSYFPEFLDNAQWKEATEKRIVDFAADACYPDGGYRESTSNYDASVLNSMGKFYAIAKESEFEIPQSFTDMYHKLGQSQMGLAQLDKVQFQWGDGAAYQNLKTVLEQTAENTGDQEMLYFSTDGVKGTPPSYTSFFLPISKLGSMRSGWNQKEDVQSFLVGRVGGGHTHRDMNHMEIYGYGRLLLVDTGQSSYDERHPAVQWQNQRTESHNTVEVNEKGQRITADDGSNLYNASDVSMHMNPKMDQYVGVSRAYDEAIHTRKVMMPKERKFFIVTDFLSPTDDTPINGNLYNQTWHFPVMADPILEPDSGVAQTRFKDGANLSVIPAEPKKLDTMSLDENPLETIHVSYKVADDKPIAITTILYPSKGEAIKVPVKILSEEDGVSAAYLFTLPDGTQARYYANNDLEREYLTEDAKVDAGTVYREENVLYGSNFFEYSEKEMSVSTSRRVNDLAVEINENKLEMWSSDFWNGDTAEIVGIDNIAEVYLNGILQDAVLEGEKYIIKGTGKKNAELEPYDPASEISLQYISGYEDGSFRPENPITRAEAAKIVAILSERFEKVTTYESVFSDVEIGKWYAGYVGFASASGIITGYGDGTFRPFEDITREEFAVLAARFAGLQPLQGYAGFPDTRGSWAEKYIHALADAGLITGYTDGNFYPQQKISRAEAVVLINRIMDIQSDKAVIEQSEEGFYDLKSEYWAYYDIMQAAAF